MFTGIIQKTGKVVANTGARLRIRGRVKGDGIGASVAVNGVCLTVTRRAGGVLSFDVSPETLKLTTLGGLKVGDRVHLEGSMTAATFLGGHIVSGHVDSTATVLETETFKDGSRRVRVSQPPAIAKLIACKGSVTLDGVSLTVTRVGRTWFETVLIPHTLKVTTLGRKAKGDRVNVEADMLARYVHNILKRTRR